MAIDSYKVSTTEVNTHNVKSAPDVLTSDAQTNKNWFDRLGEYFISKYNGLIDYLANNLTGRDGTGRGLKYEDGKVHWEYAVEPTDSFGFSYSGNIQPSGDGYDTPLTSDITLTVSDMMDCFLIVNDVEYQCEDAYQDGGLIRTKTHINGVEILLTYSTLSRDLVMSHATNPLDTTYWNVECYKSRADKVLAKSLPGNLTNAAYIELKDMIDRITGLTGKTITYTVIEYGVSNDEATPPAAWQPNPPVTTQGQWLWVKSTTIFTDGTEDTIYTKSYIGTDGEDGISVTVQSVEKHDTTTTIKLVDSDGNVSTITLEDGEDGDNGLPGANGYVHLAWANSADGSVDFSTSISYGKDYLGTYSDNTEADSQDYHDYSWTYIRGMQGEQGEPGEPGDPGTGVTKIQPQYYLSTSPNSTIGGTWTTTLNYVSGYYIWTRDEITYDDGTIDHSEAVYNKALTEACTTSYNTAQYFWVKSDSGTQNVPTGAYVTKVSRDTYDVTNPQGNSLLLRDSGVFVRSNEKTCAAYLGSGMRIYDPSSTATYDSTLGVKVGKLLAQFLGSGATIYANDSSNTVIAHLGYGQGNNTSGGTSYAPYYTLGTRTSGSSIGNYSVVEGGTNTASGGASHAEGSLTVASAPHAHAEGLRSVASGFESHAEGWATTAQGDYSHAEGASSVATGQYAHAQNFATLAKSEAQTAIGKYNKQASAENSNIAFIIGNGTSSSNRSDALTVSWNGDIVSGGHSGAIGETTTQSTGTASPPSQSWTTVSSSNLTRLSLGAGTWIIFAYAEFPSKSDNTMRGLRIYNVTASDFIALSQIRTPAGSGSGTTMLSTSAVVTPTSNTTYTLDLYQGTSSSMTGVEVRMRAVRII